jgi:hypothetical protein
MTNFLKDHPMDNGNTSFCKGSNSLMSNQNLSGLRKFGSRPFDNSRLGLPVGENSPSTIDSTLSNLYNGQGPLPQPYGRTDNARMMMKYGKRKSKRKSRKSKRKSRKSKRKSRKSKRKSRKSKKFGTTPGTPEWTSSQNVSNNVSNMMNKQAVSGSLKQAVGYSQNNIPYYEGPIISNQKPNVIGGVNLPANYTNNQMNNSYFNFGSKKIKPKSSIKPKLISLKKHKFGSFNYGPNTVGYNEPIPVYHGGGNTVNFSTGKTYVPNIVGSNITGVQSSGMTPEPWLTQSFGNKFGNNVYSPVSNGSGRNVYMQPEPDYMNSGKKLSANFGGSLITLNSSGKVTVTKT